MQERIHERIHSDLPAFEQQLSTSRSIQERLLSLTQNVDQLSDSLSNPKVRPCTWIRCSVLRLKLLKSGLVPGLTTSLTQHASLARDAADADVRYNAVAHLLQCRSQLRHLAGLVRDGRLDEAVVACNALEKAIVDPPRPLNESEVMLDMKVCVL